MKRIVLSVAVALVLSACGSSVKLDDTKVEDRKGTEVGTLATTNAGNTGGVGESTVKTVNLTDAEREAAFLKSTTRVVYFDYDSFVIRPEFQSVIEAHAKYLNANKGRKVTLEGNTDERGGREYNLALGQKRAEAVRKALLLLGVSDNQLEAVSFGKEKLAAQGGSEEAMAKNRRTEISYR
ncbi:peptidoglycan-associated lipoprotein Pal [uncultured Rhodoferax sp.]|uniref:peptidoglycan-associated lipoprotein Pal n=1 Tax=uncultured Rhodoferax sp. TaxID=223188 RepID=UPI0025F92A3C|nr:peptidoglycan-associated lipoprotein Pal [uncultured Rhodoferax sp.]